MLVEMIQPLLAPVVLISACGLLIMALNAREMSVKTRLRQFHHERVSLYSAVADSRHVTPAQRLRFEGLQVQSDHLLCRAHYVRAALALMVGCVVGLLACSLLIGLSGLHGFFGYVAVGLFVVSLLCMLAGGVVFLCELRLGLREVAYEHERVGKLCLDAVAAGEPDGVSCDDLRESGATS